MKELATLAFGKDLGVEEPLERHGRVLALHEEGLLRMDAGAMCPVEVDEIVSASHHLDGVARWAGVHREVIEASDPRRVDWKARTAHDMTIPANRRLWAMTVTRPACRVIDPIGVLPRAPAADRVEPTSDGNRTFVRSGDKYAPPPDSTRCQLTTSTTSGGSTRRASRTSPRREKRARRC